MIQSTNNQKIKQLAKLKQKKYREQAQEFLAEGEHLVSEACKRGVALEIFYTDATLIPTDFSGQLTEVSAAVLEKLTFSKTPQAIVARCSYIPKNFDLKKMKRVFLLDGLQDPGNIGTIIRTALAMGFDGLILSDDSVDLYQDKLLRSCQGANFYLPIKQASLLEVIPYLKEAGFQVYATALRNASPIQNFKATDKMAFVLGNEGNGVREATIDACDGAIYIPIQGAESLNVAIAAGMIAYQFTALKD